MTIRSKFDFYMIFYNKSHVTSAIDQYFTVKNAALLPINPNQWYLYWNMLTGRKYKSVYVPGIKYGAFW